MNRVGHAFFKTRMRDEGIAFGGEVSGHYYFRDFYCADSGTIPALLILELLGKRGETLSELLEPYRSTLLHLGRDQLRGGRPGREDRRDRGDASPTRRSPISTASRSTTTTGTSTCAPPTPSRCCACAWRASTRWPTWRPGATRCSGSSGHDAGGRRHPPAGHPDAVRGRARQLLPGRGRAADAGRLRAELRQGAGRPRARAGDARAPHRGPRADRHHPPAHRPPRAGRTSSRGARAPRCARWTCSRR